MPLNLKIKGRKAIFLVSKVTNKHSPRFDFIFLDINGHVDADMSCYIGIGAVNPHRCEGNMNI